MIAPPTRDSSISLVKRTSHCNLAFKAAASFVCGDKLNEAAKNLVAVLAENKRLALLPEIAELYEELKAQLQNTVDVVVTSAFELSPHTSIRASAC